MYLPFEYVTIGKATGSLQKWMIEIMVYSGGKPGFNLF